jgi:acetyltransferase
MTVRNLVHAFHPASVAVLGASDRADSVGRAVMRNILAGGFPGRVYPINPKYREVAGLTCHASVGELAEAPDLAVIVTPAATVPGLVGELGEKGCRAAVVITAGLTRENGLRQAMLDAARPYTLRIIGPNTVGLLLPPLKLNASFAHMDAAPGDIALLSQSGAIATSLIDWAADNGVGFSEIVSLGDMADVDVGDCLDRLAGEAATRAIVMYLESVPEPRKFMSAARAASRLKPVVVIKPGRHGEAAKAAATHTGALSGADRVVDAALRRAGILRVDGLAELFDATETLARFPPLENARVGIVTNGGGAGVLAVDRLIDWGGSLATLAPATIAALDAALPRNWSHANPVDIIGDAPADRYAAAVTAVAADANVDALLVMNCPTGIASSAEAAKAVAGLVEDGTIGGKPVLTCWLGERTAREGRGILQEAGVASYETPSAAAAAVSYLVDWSKAQRALTRVPEMPAGDFAGNREAVRAVFRAAAAEGRRMLTEPEAKAVAAAYGIPVPETVVAPTPAKVEPIAARLLAKAPAVVVKLVSRKLTHKSDAGGVVLNLATAAAAREAAERMDARIRAAVPDADIAGFAVQPMIRRKEAEELILGVSRDPVFGPVILFGAGGTAVEVMDDTAIALPPLDDVLAGDLIDRTRIGRLLRGYRDRKPADRAAIIGALDAVSQLIVDFPCIAGLDVNPLLADADGVIALDARIEIDPAAVAERGPNPALAIRPYPAEWAKDVTLAGAPYRIRPIRPSDAALYPAFLARTSESDIRFRFLAPRRDFPDRMLVRLTQLDYDREIAFVALDEAGELSGIGRLTADPDRRAAEYGLLVRSDLQGRGLGWALLRTIVDYAVAEGFARVEGTVLADNVRMLRMAREFGFTVAPGPDPAIVTAALDIAAADSVSSPSAG